MAIKWRVLANKQFYFLFIGLTIYFLAISIKYSELHITIFLDYLALFIIVYTCVKALKFNYFKIYEYLLFQLAIIGIIFWIIQFILGGDTLLYQLNKIPGINSISFVSGNGLNAIFYSVQPFGYNLINNLGSGIPRNCGYAWEPGAFAVYLCLAIFINLFIIKTDKKSKIRLWILITALLTTQSTTGYSMFLIIMLFYYYNKRTNIMLLTFPIFVIGIIFIFSLPFMSNKIIDLSNNSDNIEMIVFNSINREEATRPQRFVSFLIAFEDFRQNPILGIVGGGDEASWTSKINANIAKITGIGNLLAQFGIVGALFFVILTIKSSILLSQHYNYKGKLLLFFLILFISISYTILFFPLVASFWMFSVFTQNNNSKKIMSLNRKKIIRFNYT